MTDALPEHAHGTKHVGTNVLSAITRKLGPLPGWAWVLLIVTAYYLYHRYASASTAPAPVTALDVTGADSAGDTGGAGSVGQGGGAGSSGGMIPAPPGSGLSAAPNNATWAQGVAGQLIAGGSSPSDVNNALNDYLNGNPLSPTEQAIIDQVLQQGGEPPEGVLPVVAAPIVPIVVPPVHKPPTGTPAPAPKPVPKPAPKPVAHKPAPKPKPKPKPAPSKTYTVRSGDSLYSIASHYYGNGNDYEKIYKANKGTIGHNPSLIKPGQKLVIPK